MRYLVLAAMRVFMKTIATNICGVNCAACLEWIARANQPELFTSPIAFLRFTMALRVSWVNSNT